MWTNTGSRWPRLIAATVATSALVLAAPVARPAAAQVPVPTAPVALPKKIEKLSPYLPQVSCDPVAKPGVIAFARLVRRTYPGTGSSRGITRGCSVGGRSEHKEGRAWDWAVSAHDRPDAAKASALLTWLLQKDARGKKYGNARRLGIMYIIWNRRIWIAAQATDGWRPYTGANPHTDHVHFSFGWAGAMRRTSFWTGKVAKTDYGPCPRNGGLAPRYTGPNSKRCRDENGNRTND